MQSLSSFMIVNTTAAKNFASLDSPIQFASTQACACGRTISEIPLLPWVHTRSQVAFSFRGTNKNAVKSLSKKSGAINDFPHNKKLFYICA
jgi:hypothetical protein